MEIVRILAQNKKVVFFVADAVLVALSVWLAFMIRFEAAVPGQYFEIIARLVLIGWIFYLPALAANRLYSFSWSYVSASELIALARAVGLGFLLQTAVLYLFRDFAFFSGFPRSTIFVAAFFVFILCGGIRFAKRIYFYFFRRNNGEGVARVLIAGAGDAGEQLLRSIQSSGADRYFAAGFVDNNDSRQGSIIHGAKVLGKIAQIPEVVSRHNIGELIIALPPGSKSVREAVRLAKTAGLKKIRIVPPLADIIDGKFSLANVRRVEVEDLLERDKVSLDMDAIGKFITGKKVLITGAAGSIGSELCRQTAKFKPAELTVLDQDETGIFNIGNELKKHFADLPVKEFVADIQNASRMKEIFSEIGPQIVFHAAAYKHVPLMEQNAGEAVRNNVFGTKNLADAAISAGAQNFIFISTDKAINPTSVMGATKRIGEMICQAANGAGKTKFVSVRFGNVLGSRGSVIPIFREQIRRGGPVEVTHPEMKRYFMLTSEACLLVMQAGALGKGGEVFVLDMGKPVKIVDLAKEMIKLSGFKPDIDMPIVYIGIRPGEKLFEELMAGDEAVSATQSEKIFIAKLAAADERSLAEKLESLKNAARMPEKQSQVVLKLRSLVPEFCNNEKQAR